MGSRIMHFIIAKRIAEEMGINNQMAFLLGGVAPDAVYPKNKSHFLRARRRIIRLRLNSIHSCNNIPSEQTMY